MKHDNGRKCRAGGGEGKKDRAREREKERERRREGEKERERALHRTQQWKERNSEGMNDCGRKKLLGKLKDAEET